MRRQDWPGTPHKLLTCGGCLAFYYCSAPCQKQHWPQHRAVCKSQRRQQLDREEGALIEKEATIRHKDKADYRRLIAAEAAFIGFRSGLLAGRPETLNLTHLLRTDHIYQPQGKTLRDRFKFVRAEVVSFKQMRREHPGNDALFDKVFPPKKGFGPHHVGFLVAIHALRIVGTTSSPFSLNELQLAVTSLGDNIPGIPPAAQRPLNPHWQQTMARVLEAPQAEMVAVLLEDVADTEGAKRAEQLRLGAAPGMWCTACWCVCATSVILRSALARP